ncbi:MAG: ATP-NAD kinase family protein [Haloarculaceae archaeon]
MRTIGVVVNPIAGMGGRVGLKGTDGKATEAAEQGAVPRAPDRAVEALRALVNADQDVELLAAGGVMGADEAREAGIDPEVVTDPPGAVAVDSTDPEALAEATSAADTEAAVEAFLDRDVDLVLFVGGDGTAVDVVETLDARDADTPILGVPAGVKVYSAVFAVDPRAAGHVAASFDRTETAEVNDIDEDSYREGEVRSELRGMAAVPVAEQRQAGKQLAGGSVAGLAEGLAAQARTSAGVTFVFGPGSTVGAIEEALDVDPSPLGVDVWRGGEVLVRDGGEAEILDALGAENVIVVSPIGGQGFLLGRGNQQLSPAVVRQCDLEVVASRKKLREIGVLRVDTGDPDLDEELRGWQKVRVGRHERRLVEVV